MKRKDEMEENSGLSPVVLLLFSPVVQQTAEHFAKTINKLKGKVTMLFITHQIPRGLQVDEVFSFGDDYQHTTKVEVMSEKP